MYTHIYQNSYIVTFIFLCIILAIFYFFDIKSSIEISKTGEISKKFNWKMPLALTLLFWLLWHFVIFPPIDTKPNQTKKIATPSIEDNVIVNQKFNVANWN